MGFKKIHVSSASFVGAEVLGFSDMGKVRRGQDETMSVRTAEFSDGQIYAKSQATQTMPVQTEPPTQLMSHEVHQFTQLINNDFVERFHGDTMVNDSDLEGSGDTEVLPDDDDDNDDGHGNVQSGLALSGPSLQEQTDVVRSCKSGLHGDGGADHRAINAPGLAPLKLIGGLLDSDATTEEGEAEDIGCLETAESWSPHRDTIKDHEGDRPLEVLKSGLDGMVNACNTSQDNLSSRQTPKSALVADVNAKHSPSLSTSGLRPKSIASVRAVSLRASGLRAASRNASAEKDDTKYDSEATVELTPGMVGGESEKPLEALEAGLHGTGNHHTRQAACLSLMQMPPKATLITDDANLHSPRMSTSKSKSRSVSPVRASLLCASVHHEATCNVFSEKDTRDQDDSDAIIKLTPKMVEGLPPYSKVLKKLKAGGDHAKSILTSVESLTPDLKKSCSQASLVSADKGKQHAGVRVAREGAHESGVEMGETKVHSRQPSGQKVRKLVFDSKETSPTSSTDKPEHGSGKLVSNALQTDFVSLQKKPIHAIHAPAREQQGSLPFGYHAAATNSSYPESQEPGEESQMNALNVVDKLVWLDATCMPQDTGTKTVPQDSSVKGHQGTKVLQSLAQAAQMKTMHDKLDVYDWVDSQLDEGPPFDVKSVSDTIRARKKQSETSKSSIGRKRQASSQQLKVKSILHMENKVSDTASVGKGMDSFVAGQTVVPNMEPSSGDQCMKPHTLLTTRLRNRTRVESGSSSKGKKSYSVKSELGKRRAKKKPIDELGKDTERPSGTIMHQQGGDNGKGKVQNADEISPKGKAESTKAFEVGGETETATVATDRMSHGVVSDEVWKEAFKSKTPKGNHLEEMNSRKRSVLHDDTRQDSKNRRTTDAVTPSELKGRRVSLRGREGEQQHNLKKEEKATEEDMMKRGPKTRSKAQDLTGKRADSSANEGKTAKSAITRHSNTQIRVNQDNAPLSPKQAIQADLDMEKPSFEAGGSKVKKSSVTQQQSVAKTSQKDAQHEVDGGMTGNSDLLPGPTSINGKGKEEPAAGGPKRSKRKREASVEGLSESFKDYKSETKKSFSNLRDPGFRNKKSLHVDVSNASISRRTRSSMCDAGSENKDSASEQGVQSDLHKGHPDTVGTVGQMLRDKSDVLDVNKGLHPKDGATNKQVAVPATVTAKLNPRRNKKIAISEMLTTLDSSPLVEEGRRRKREPGCIRVLFSHSLPEETTKHQKKILAKLGGHVATSVSDCTHFICNGFVRTQNMLISMAAGKLVVTPLWLESCGQAHYFVDEKKYILQDEKKEKEVGFSMHSSLAAARRKPLMKGVKVLVSPSTIPESKAIKEIIESAGGQALQKASNFLKPDANQNNTLSIIIASDKDYEFCLQFLDKGFKAYSTELILHGIVTQNLDFSRNRLFEDYGHRKGSRRVANTNV